MSTVGTSFKSVCILPDANVWIKTALLADSFGSALVYYCATTGTRIGLPEVVEREIHKTALRLARLAVDKIKDGHRRLRVFGFEDRAEIPANEDVLKRTQSRLADLAPYIVKVTFTHDHAKSALNRLLEGSPPNSAKSEQFRDSAIWEAVLELGSRYAVRFITDDRAFYEGHDPAKGLASLLQDEVRNSTLDIVVYPDLGSLLAVLQGQVTIPDYAAICKRITAAVDSPIRDIAAKNGVDVSDLLDARSTAIPGAGGGSLPITFRIRYLAGEKDEAGEPKRAEVTAQGSGALAVDVSDIKVAELRLSEITIDYAGFSRILVLVDKDEASEQE